LRAGHRQSWRRVQGFTASGKAIAEFDLALAIDPNHIAAWINRGETLLVLRRLDEALASFDRALSINPQIALAWLGPANILMLTGKLADSAAACERALAIEPNSPKALTQLGQYMRSKVTQRLPLPASIVRLRSSRMKGRRCH